MEGMDDVLAQVERAQLQELLQALYLLYCVVFQVERFEAGVVLMCNMINM